MNKEDKIYEIDEKYVEIDYTLRIDEQLEWKCTVMINLLKCKFNYSNHQNCHLIYDSFLCSK